MAAKTLAVVLIVASSWSFVPQLQLLWSSRSTDRLSNVYVLVNLISATQQLTIGLHGILVEPESFMHHQPKANFDDWLNVVQFVVVWIGHLATFFLVVSFSSSGIVQKGASVVIYAAYLSGTLAIIVYEVILGDVLYADWVRAMFLGMHIMYVNPVVHILAIVAFLFQARAMRSETGTASLSVQGLRVQSAVFFVVGVAWFFRLRIPRGGFYAEPGQPRYSAWTKLLVWYQMIGWATVANVIFAFVRGGLFLVARRHDEVTRGVAEAAPLLG
ncbi:hypothetical protein Slin15195_G067710 [Septoria linicola]|uniref:Uncharacterized protein n=1 Tax=Septoria linicola TaxID=215465 RepID=A0A9Q9APR2_9PEZI|nr:hypothetical protein Slin15195_G067710 [Septoria linicola]